MKNLRGKITGLKMLNTAIVEVERHYPHPLYRKIITRNKRYKADVNNLELSLGDSVEIAPTMPISKDKHFKVVKKII